MAVIATRQATGRYYIAPGFYAYQVMTHYNRAGVLVFRGDEVSFECEPPEETMGWNYNMLRKVKLGPESNQITLVFHGGDRRTFTVTRGRIAPNLPAFAATRIAAAPRDYYGS